ncbi:MAG TPA: hypothetical protein PK609_02400 [Candidatus Paceibacterota bacterium]|nr:hypothetical protein [Candidatus Paceibacterota bacterium]
MTMIRYGAFALVLTLGLSSAGGVQAQFLDLTSSTSVTGSAQTTGVEVDATTDTTVETDKGTITTTSANATTTSEAETIVNFRLTRSELDDGTNYAQTESYSVRSAASLEAYAATLLRNDERVKDIRVEQDSFELHYNLAARFLGFIPGSVTAKVAVDGEGQVSVKYPWYAFLMATDESRAELEARIASDLAEENGLSADASATTSASTSRIAQLMESVRVSLTANASASAEAQ